MKKLTDLAWQIEASSYMHRSPWFTVRKDNVLLPNGARIPQYFVLEYPAWVCTIAVTKTGEMLLISQYRHGIGKTSYEICAGVVERVFPELCQV